ncbi:hypothetical protein [Umboniibacter marinipuniceus]|uniref:Uncharacterized protein n=1 Tax=Umboniibacter marinipuniceus TaxID=569599 RepID=A0A3M0A7I2_9GAMM|nr:hypothetical protein [Umboniibacter marinipuniceus]RMA78768.1 hypothetical protein DFR27_2107 [Umboniibacter marinipuniceus]
MSVKDKLNAITSGQASAEESAAIAAEAKARIVYLEDTVRQLQRDAHMAIHIKLCADALSDA